MPKSVHVARSTFYHDRCCFLPPSCRWMKALARAALLLHLYSASLTWISYENNVSLAATAQETTTCGNDLRTIYDHYDLWSAFMVDTLEKCRAGISPEMCIQNNSTEFQRMDTITIFEDLRELRTSNEYTGLVSACQSEGEQEDGTAIQVYYSIGEFDGITVNFHENDSSTQYEAFEDDCYANNGEICTVDVIVTLQRYVGSQVSDLEVDDSNARVDINSYFRGWPQCFPSSCNYTQRASVAEQTSLDFIFKLATYEENDEEESARQLRHRTLLRSGGENNREKTHALAPLASESMKDTLLSVVENAGLDDYMKSSKKTNGASRLLGEKEDDKSIDEEDKSIDEEGEGEAEDEDEDDIKDAQQDISTTRDILLDLIRNIDPSKSPNVTKEYPYELFDNSNKSKKPQERAFTRSEECPTGIDECFSRLSNVCLRSIGTPIERNDDNENADENNENENNEDGSEDSLLGDLIPFAP